MNTRKTSSKFDKVKWKNCRYLEYLSKKSHPI
jgi:hypothetical protein